MGSISAMSSIARVLDAHGQELRDEVLAALPATVRAIDPRVVLTNATYSIQVEVQFAGHDGDPETMELAPYDIDDIAERFPDCEVGY